MSSTSKKRKRVSLPSARLVLAIDPAKASGVALFLDGKLVAHGPAAGDSFRSLLLMVRPMVQPYLAEVPEDQRVTVLEQHWMSFRSVKGSLTLGQRRGIAQSVGEALGFPRWEYVGASTWQSFVFGGKRVPDTKAAAMQFVRDTYHFEPATDDVADAVCLGHYFLSRGVDE